MRPSTCPSEGHRQPRHPRTCPRRAGASICRSPSASSRRRGRSTAGALDQVELLGELALVRGAAAHARHPASGAGRARSGPRSCCCPTPTRPRRPWCATSVSCLRPGTCSRSARTSPGRSPSSHPRRPAAASTTRAGVPDLADVRGQAHAKRALEIAAAGAPQPADGRAAWDRQVDAGAADCRASCRRWARRRRWRRRPSSPLGHGPLDPRPLLPPRPSVRRTTRPRPPPWSAAAAPRARARSRSPTTACSSSTSCPSSTAASSRCCASRWRRAESSSRAPRARSSFPPASSSSRR